MMAVDNVYRVHSTVEVPHDRLDDYLDDPDLPPTLDRLDTTRRGNQLFIEAVPAADDIGPYTPTARLRATITDARIYEYEGERHRTRPSVPGDTEVPSTVETVAKFKGRLGTVLKHSALRAPAFGVLHEIARLAERGKLTAIVDRDGDLDAVAVDAGEDQPASVEVVEDEPEQAAGSGPAWQQGHS